MKKDKSDSEQLKTRDIVLKYHQYTNNSTLWREIPIKISIEFWNLKMTLKLTRKKKNLQGKIVK